MFLVFLWKCIRIHIPLGEIKMFVFLLVEWYDKNIPTWKFQCLVCLKYASCAKTFATHYIQSLNIRIFVLVNTNSHTLSQNSLNIYQHVIYPSNIELREKHNTSKSLTLLEQIIHLRCLSVGSLVWVKCECVFK